MGTQEELIASLSEAFGLDDDAGKRDQLGALLRNLAGAIEGERTGGADGATELLGQLMERARARLPEAAPDAGFDIPMIPLPRP